MLRVKNPARKNFQINTPAYESPPVKQIHSSELSEYSILTKYLFYILCFPPDGLAWQMVQTLVSEIGLLMLGCWYRLPASNVTSDSTVDPALEHYEWRQDSSRRCVSRKNKGSYGKGTWTNSCVEQTYQFESARYIILRPSQLLTL